MTNTLAYFAPLASREHDKLGRFLVKIFYVDKTNRNFTAKLLLYLPHVRQAETNWRGQTL